MKRLVVICLGVLFAFPAIARGDAIIDWNLHAQNTILTTVPPPTAHASTLSFAMVHGAVYDAVNAIDRSHRPYLRVAPVRRPASQDAAAATAAFRVLVALYPAQATVLQANYDASLAKLPADERRARGIAAGEAAAAAMLAARANDGRMAHGAPYPYPLGTEPGAWRVSPPLTAVDPAWWVGDVRPFVIPSARWFGTPGPNPLTSRAYARDLNEVKEIGALASTTRTADQTMAAVFWQAQPLQLYGGVLRDLSARYQLSPAQNARLFGRVTLAAADAAISCWNDKYRHLFWRPIDAIRNAGTDGNPKTEADPNWLPLFDPSTQAGLATPNFPDHPSGHSCVSSSIINTLQDFFHTDRIAFDVSSPRFPGQTRHFERFSQVLDEIIEARVWGGIHFRTADVQGAQLGERVARWHRWFAFRPDH
ncbi:vanadium-dependent haloperoxidase [Solirubrobacter ginsenosidimutans]|uniref:Vanadium-dependent haloperoxidase n=1 Tax=Solirubrobacter ginsenosidimutans TaxID=490573 RepID=A0A9X3N045_9ACTN|nr:vanadium-dependent haloperoxidase [Solirubrobacter ginsenosidimutans]MDA0165994.1 vanadium-dependent haloperoxidase [Solirubrobacter ginsenosidimutans]